MGLSTFIPRKTSNNLYHKLYPLLVASVFTAIGVAYLSTRADAASAAAPAAAPVPSVDVLVLSERQLRTWANFSGRLAPVDSAEVKPLVSGAIQQVLFKDGQRVEKGQPLFLIDPRAHQAAAKRALAQLATAKSRAQLAQDELRRSQQLLKSKLVSQSAFDAASSAYEVAGAQVKEAEAALAQAQLDLEYAHITAPIAGRVGRAELTTGNVVDAGANAPVLTRIVATDKLYAEFNVDEATYVQFVRQSAVPSDMPVELTLASDASVSYKGHITAFDNQLDSGSGTIRARALFENKDGALTAGMFANIRLGSAQKTAAILLPERAIGTNQSKKFVLVVDAQNLATYREITLGDSFDGERLVTSGLKAGERVIVNGLSHVRPNTPVNPVVVSDSAKSGVVAAR